MRHPAIQPKAIELDGKAARIKPESAIEFVNMVPNWSTSPDGWSKPPQVRSNWPRLGRSHQCRIRPSSVEVAPKLVDNNSPGKAGQQHRKGREDMHARRRRDGGDWQTGSGDCSVETRSRGRRKVIPSYVFVVCEVRPLSTHGRSDAIGGNRRGHVVIPSATVPATRIRTGVTRPTPSAESVIDMMCSADAGAPHASSQRVIGTRHSSSHIPSAFRSNLCLMQLSVFGPPRVARRGLSSGGGRPGRRRLAAGLRRWAGGGG